MYAGSVFTETTRVCLVVWFVFPLSSLNTVTRVTSGRVYIGINTYTFKRGYLPAGGR